MLSARTAINAACLALLLAAPAAGATGAETTDSSGAFASAATGVSPNRLIVEWTDGSGRLDRASARADAGVTSMRMLGAADFQLLETGPDQSIGVALATLRGDPSVRVVARDGYSSLEAIPNDPFFDQLWALRNPGDGIAGFEGAVAGADIDALGAWSRTVGTPSTVIADLDSGYRFDAADLGPVAWSNPGEIADNSIDDDGNGYVDDTRGYDFVGPSAESPVNDNDPTDDNIVSGGHGVHTAGTMGAAGGDGVGITGVAQDVRIMPLRICASSAKKETVCPFSSQVAAINYAGDNGARVANMSLGGTTSNSAVRDALAGNPQTLYVIAAGNDSQDNDSAAHYPCNYNPATSGIPGAIDNVICVAATDQADGLASFSDWGATTVDLGAPGTETLSTYPAIGVEFEEDFEANDFTSTWANSGGEGFGRADPGDGPLASFGMSDSPGETPEPNSVHSTTLASGIALPTGTGSCSLSGMRHRSAGIGGGFSYSVLSDGEPRFTNSGSTATGGSSMALFRTEPITGLGGHSITLSFAFTAGPSPSPGDGIWLDDLKLTCYRPLTTPVAYAYLQGTSMAAPQVTGTAGLLFSLKPSATVTEVRNALLAGADPIPSLAGKTVSGGRLDASAAIGAFDVQPPPAPQLTSTVPASPADDNHPRIVGSAEEVTTISIYQGDACEGAPLAIGTAAELASPGIAVAVADGSTRQFSAVATDLLLNESACSLPIGYTNSRSAGSAVFIGPLATNAASLPGSPRCTVPNLAGKTLAEAKGELASANCGLGKVRKPRRRKGRRPAALVVKASSPGVGAQLPAGNAIDLTLVPRPNSKKRRHH